MTSLSQEPLQSIQTIKKQVERLVQTTKENIEDITFTVWLEVYTHNHENPENPWIPNPQIIKNIATDWLRHEKVMNFHEKPYGSWKAPSHCKAFDAVEYCHELLERSSLTEPERWAIWYTFWAGDLKSVDRQALKTGMFKLLLEAKKRSPE